VLEIGGFEYLEIDGLSEPSNDPAPETNLEPADSEDVRDDELIEG
jgi:hypothetical protein